MLYYWAIRIIEKSQSSLFHAGADHGIAETFIVESAGYFWKCISISWLFQLQTNALSWKINTHSCNVLQLSVLTSARSLQSIVVQIALTCHCITYQSYHSGILYLHERLLFHHTAILSKVVATVAAQFVEVIEIFPAAVQIDQAANTSIHWIAVNHVHILTGVVQFKFTVHDNSAPVESRYKYLTDLAHVQAIVSFAEVDTIYNVCHEVGTFCASWEVSRYWQASHNIEVLFHPRSLLHITHTDLASFQWIFQCSCTVIYKGISWESVNKNHSSVTESILPIQLKSIPPIILSNKTFFQNIY